MKILMIGLGSIGQRHLRNIKRVLGDDAQILAYRVRGLQRTFSDTMQIREDVCLEEEFHIQSFQDLDEALAQKPDAAFITNPTNLHIPCALQCAKAGCHLFLEKPISDDLIGIDELERIVREKGLKVFVGYQNRFHPAVRMVKEAIEKEELGRILSVHAVVGERLTTMHTYEDYKDTYMARKDMGGGVVTNQLVHEMDYLYDLFGEPINVYAVGGTLGNLGIDVEDNCDALFQMKGRHGSSITVNVHADFYQSPPSRFVKVVGEKGQIEADLLQAQVTKTIQDVTQQAAFPKFTRNDMFIEELTLFLSCIREDTKEAISLQDGIVSLKMAMAIKESMKTGGIVNVNL
jgi:predicted dehydrogenase